MPRNVCPACGNADLVTDQTAGNVYCSACGFISEDGILVSEVGFAEGSGGRVHVQGAFVSNYATGISGLRGRGGPQSTEHIKAQGQQKIGHVGERMGLNNRTKLGAQRLFALAVDNNFNRGRRTDYVVASCLYLQSRLSSEPHMLIDFSERLAVNVFELGATYLKLRSILHLPDPMPQTDPAIYNLRFANRLHFGTSTNAIASDASRLIRRFQADWMSEGRRPAGVCGACLVIAARMNGQLRTPEEVAQVVKVSHYTIKRRLLEFAQTSMSAKTVAEWRNMTDEQLKAPGEIQPPVVKEQLKKEERMRIRAEKQKALGAQGAGGGEGGDDEEDQDELTDDYEYDQSPSGSRPRRRKRKRDNESAVEDDDIAGAIRAAAAEMEQSGDLQGDEEDLNLDVVPATEWVHEFDQAGDDPETAKAERLAQISAFKRMNRVNSKVDDDRGVEIDDDDLEILADADEIETDHEKEDDYNDDEEDDLQEVDEGAQGNEGGGNATNLDVKREKKPIKFERWDDTDALYRYLEDRFFSRETQSMLLDEKRRWERLSLWLKGRDPQQVVHEIEIVNRALKARDLGSRAEAEVEFPDIDDGELDAYWVMEDGERSARARMWLSHNGKWLEEEREKQEKREQFEKENGIVPEKRKRKKRRGLPKQGPFPTAQKAMEGLSSQKNFSNRIDYGVLKSLFGESGNAAALGLQQMEDEDEYRDEKQDEKADEYGPRYDEDEREGEYEGYEDNEKDDDRY